MIARILNRARIGFPTSAKPILDWAPGNLASMDHHRADELVDMGVDPRPHHPDLVLTRPRQLYGPGWWR